MLYATMLPELTEFTIHMWYYGLRDDDEWSDDWMISIASAGERVFIKLEIGGPKSRSPEMFWRLKCLTLSFLWGRVDMTNNLINLAFM